MATIAEHAVKVGADISDFEAGMSEVNKQTQTMSEQLGKIGGTMSKWVTGPIAAAGGGLAAMTMRMAATGDEIAKTSTKLGITTDALQEMEYWASQNGISQSALERAVGRLNQRIGMAADGNEKYAEAFEAVNVSLHDTEGNLRSTEDVMYDTIAALRSIEDPAERSAKASEIFGTRMARDLMPALEDSSLSLEEAAERAHELGIVMDEDTLKASEQFNDALDDIKRTFQASFFPVFAEAMEMFQEHFLPIIEERIIPALHAFTETIGEVISWFLSLDGSTQALILGFVGLLAAIGPVLLVISKLIPLFVGLFSPVGLIIAAIAALTAGFIYLWETNEQFRDIVMSVWEEVSQFGEVIFGMLRDFFEDVWNSIKATAETVWGWILASWEVWGDSILAVGEFVWNTIQTIIETIINVIKDIIGMVLAIIRGDWEEVWNRIKSIGETIWNAITIIVENYINTVMTVISNILNTISSIWQSIWGGISNALSGIWSSITSAVSGGINNVRNLISNGISGALSVVTGMASSFLNAGREIVMSIANGIRNAIGSVTDAISGVMSSVRNFLPFSPPKEGPLTDIGKLDFAGPISDSIEGAQREINMAMEHTLDVDATNVSGGIAIDDNSSTSGENDSFKGMFDGATFNVREEADIEKIARQIHRRFETKKRGQGRR